MIKKCINYMNSLSKAIFRLIEAATFSIKLKFSEQANIGIFYSLSDIQISDFQDAIKDENFKTDFNITPIKKLQVIIMQTKYNKLHFNNEILVIQTIHPIIILLITLVKNSILDLKIHSQNRKRKLIFDQIYLKLSLSEKIILLILNSYKNLSLFTTISTLGKNPIEFILQKELRNFSTYQIHYAQNTLPVDLAYDSIRNQIPDYLTDSNFDTHFVWSQEYAHVLSLKKSETKYEVVGPILFRLNKLNNPSTALKKSIVIFDVTIQKSAEHQEFYSEEMGLNFLEDIIETVNSFFSKKEFNLYLKPKRAYNDKIHSKKYLEKIFDYNDKKVLKLYKPELDIFELLREARLSISVPFTTTAVLSREMRVPSVYYYPYINHNLNNIHKKSIPLISGKTQLETYFAKNFSQD